MYLGAHVEDENCEDVGWFDALGAMGFDFDDIGSFAPSCFYDGAAWFLFGIPEVFKEFTEHFFGQGFDWRVLFVPIFDGVAHGVVYSVVISIALSSRL